MKLILTLYNLELASKINALCQSKIIYIEYWPIY